jgi:hypothetical protein
MKQLEICAIWLKPTAVVEVVLVSAINLVLSMTNKTGQSGVQLAKYIPIG